MRLHRSIVIIGWAALLLPVFAQISANKASLAGVVSDPAGVPVSGASVHVNNEATGLHRETATNSAGLYQFNDLEPGTYEIRIESAGIGASMKNVDLNLGGALRLNIVLAVQTSTSVVDLTTSAMSVAESSPGEVMVPESIQTLPINGRRFQDFATLMPTVQATAETRGQLSFLGQRAIYSNVMLDGGDYNEPVLGGIRGGERSNFAFTVPQSAVQEFQAITSSGLPVEYGHSTGGILNAITKSGSNAVHGEGFYHNRNQALGMGDPLGRQSLERQQQFGGSLGGPVRKDRLFFFAAAEQQLASYPRSVRFPALDAIGADVTADIAPAYNYFRSLERPFHQTNNATAVFGRVDYQLSADSRVALRYNDSRNQAANAVAPGASLLPDINQAFSTNGTDRDHTRTGGAQWTVGGSTFVNDARVQYGREDSSLKPNAISPYVDAGVIGSFGTLSTLPQSLEDYRIQAADSVLRVVGQHSISFGGDYAYIGFSQLAGANQFGSFSVSSSDVRRTLQILSGTAMNRFDDASVIYSRQVGGLQLSAHAQQIGAYAQDTWRITPAFTLTYGFRWEGQLNPQPIANNDFLVSNVRDFQFPRGRLDPTVIRNPLAQWSPRLSFAWDPFSSGKTIIRGKAGIFYAQTPLIYLTGALTDVSTAPSDLTLQIAPANGRTVYQQFQAGGFDLNRYSLPNLPIFSIPDVWVDVAGKPNPYAQANVITTSGQNFQNPRSAQLGLSVEHKFARNLVVGYDLNHIVSVHLERNVPWNVPEPFVRPGDQSQRPFFGLRSGVPRPNPNLGWIIVRESSAKANYTGNTFRAQYKRDALELGLNYTLSFNKSDDDNERELIGLAFPNPYDFSRDYNWSALDARHQANGFAIVHARGGINVSGLLHYRSGLPIDPSTGGDTSELLMGNLGNRPLERPGLLMLRNSFRNRAFKTVDLRVAKEFSLSERTRIEVYGDLFNLFNFDNVAFISSALYPDNPAFIYGLGVLQNGQLAPVSQGFLRLRTISGKYDPVTTAQQGTPFQAQVGLRFKF